ncbi:hypothetical protein ALQ93_102156 [Pseudomonas syringae pv. pisi]|uniref:Uncharacterized protein n=3 Tax=Pseudomonas syringae group TaxID=136849 RepID=F3G8Q9_PSESJ|nr:hypothetical protein PSYPI_14133 [Pseudomonas syringae pv. pisi str. 1704B]RML60116.1 hypothetical protein ALQ93_102156 [Pseudomonas syringae pv. pisi]RMU83201.1 hypothetical protein ALP21_101868 [Pseudomonas savastanoi pv. phaseolicola]RML61901.1 hypothetical protein ALQ92_101800 [Pseudomonas syringae pv. pisi]RMM19131.1 hypothetical protein ALQ82_101801 [Pseudomonas syringae pv. pisi]
MTKFSVQVYLDFTCAVTFITTQQSMSRLPDRVLAKIARQDWRSGQWRHNLPHKIIEELA